MNAYTNYLTYKTALENLFGSDAWYALKESNHLGTWRKYALKTLKAIEISIKDTVQIRDDEWLEEILERLARGAGDIKQADSIEEVIAVVAGTLIEVSFLQIGLMPRRKGRPGPYPLRRGMWKLDGFRSVAYLQTVEQKEARFLSEQQRQIGFDAQFDLQAEYRRSKSKLSYMDWCAKTKNGAGGTL